MGVLDKFLNIMKLDDEYDDEDFIGEEEEFEEYEEKPKKSFFKKDKEEFHDFDLQEENQTKQSSVANHTNNKVTPMRQPNGKRAASMEVCVIKPTAVDDAREITETLLSGRTVILNLEGIDLEVAQRIIEAASMEVCVIKPTAVDDAREITETLLSGRTVILNLEGIDLEVAQRIIDFTSGATYAISGNLQKISNYIFLVTPTNVEISGDLQDLLNTSFDVPSIRTRF